MLADIRRLEFDRQTGNEVKSVVNAADYALTEEKRELLAALLPQLAERYPWDATRQAWTPFLEVYLYSGVDPDLTTKWADKLLTSSPAVAPKKSPVSDIAHMLRVANWNPQGALKFTYDDFVDFAETILWIREKRSAILEVIENRSVFDRVCGKLLSDIDDFNYSPYFPYVLNCYQNIAGRLSMRVARVNKQAAEDPVLAQLSNQVDLYRQTFEDHVKWVRDFIDHRYHVYKWYDDKNVDIIFGLWQEAMQRKHFTLLSFKETYERSFHEAETMMKYAKSLPHVYQPDVDKQFIFDTLHNMRELGVGSTGITRLTADSRICAELLCGFYLEANDLSSVHKHYRAWAFATLDKSVTKGLVSNYKMLRDLGQRNCVYSVDEFTDALLERGFPEDGLF